MIHDASFETDFRMTSSPFAEKTTSQKVATPVIPGIQKSVINCFF